MGFDESSWASRTPLRGSDQAEGTGITSEEEKGWSEEKSK
jgi:hypothetical protein